MYNELIKNQESLTLDVANKNSKLMKTIFEWKRFQNPLEIS
jgi:plasmid maintenance system antidote protein VapI